MNAPLRTPHVLLAVRPVAAAAVEPGDLLLGPDLTAPTRVWWRLDGGSRHTLLLPPGPGSPMPRQHQLPGGSWSVVADRNASAWPPEQTVRLLNASRGALWLLLNCHRQAPPERDVQLLLSAYARGSGQCLERAVAQVRAGLPGLAT